MAETPVITASSINKVRIKFVQIFMMICIKDETSKLTEVFKSPNSRILNVSQECQELAVSKLNCSESFYINRFEFERGRRKIRWREERGVMTACKKGQGFLKRTNFQKETWRRKENAYKDAAKSLMGQFALASSVEES